MGVLMIVWTSSIEKKCPCISLLTLSKWHGILLWIASPATQKRLDLRVTPLPRWSQVKETERMSTIIM